MANKKSYKRAAKKAAKTAKKYPKVVITLVVIILIIAITIGVLWVVKPELFSFLFKPDDNDGGGGGSAAAGSPEELKTSELSIHFLELGNKYTGDCTLIKCGDTEVLIDAGSRDNSAPTLKKYIDAYCTDGKLEYVIATHAHNDHISGFFGQSNDGILYSYDVGTIITFSGANADPTKGIYKKFLDAKTYAESRGTVSYTAKQCWYETDGAAKTYYLNEERTVSINILYQKYYDEKYSSGENNYSVCMLLTQQLDGKAYNYIFTGDLEKAGEESLAASNDLPQVELYKGGHHGSKTSSNEALLKKIKPKNIAICTCCGSSEFGAKPENTFPTQDFVNRVAPYTENIYCTTLMVDFDKGEYKSMNGNIVFYTVSGELKLWCSDNDTKLKDTEWFKQNRVWPTN